MEGASPEVAVIKMYKAREEIYPREVQGRYASLRWFFVWATQLLFYGLPWLSWNDRQAVLFDLGARKFYIFGIVLWPQDFIYLAALLIISAYSLFLFTAIFGRVWCGFTCPQTVYTEIFMWIERKIEGNRSARMRLDRQPLSAEKLARKSAKHAVWGAVALWTGFTFVGYFTPIHVLAGEVAALTLGPWEWFWVLFYAFATYGNAGWMREQVCKYMCPYARFQSAMFDKDSLIITYDKDRGEPRGARSKNDPDSAKNLGDCIDCSMCVQVCPTGIDIRKGLQYECIGCGACADVCDTVMDKVGYPRGLIKYSTQNAMAGGWSREQTWKRVLRPRVLLYTGILLAVTLALLSSLALRKPFKVDVVRDRAALARIVSGGQIENVYRLQIMNAAEKTLHFKLETEGLPGLRIVTETDVLVPATESRWVSVRLQLPYDAAKPGSHPIHFRIESYEDGVKMVGEIQEKSVFLVPR